MSELNRQDYRIITACLFQQDLVEAERIAKVLRDVGWPHSNRSLVIRESVHGLADALRGKSAEEIFRYFVDRQSRRAHRTIWRPS